MIYILYIKDEFFPRQGKATDLPLSFSFSFAGCLGRLVFEDVMFHMDTFTFVLCTQGRPENSITGFFTIVFPASTCSASSSLFCTDLQNPNPLVTQQQFYVQCSSFIIKEQVLLSSVLTPAIRCAPAVKQFV